MTDNITIHGLNPDEIKLLRTLFYHLAGAQPIVHQVIEELLQKHTKEGSLYGN